MSDDPSQKPEELSAEAEIEAAVDNAKPVSESPPLPDFHLHAGPWRLPPGATSREIEAAVDIEIQKIQQEADQKIDAILAWAAARRQSSGDAQPSAPDKGAEIAALHDTIAQLPPNE